MAQDNRKRHIVSYENMSPELAAAFAAKYPKGFNDYLPDLTRYTKPDGTPFYAVLIELPEDIYLVKIKVQIDNPDDIERWLEGEEEAETESMAGTSGTSDSEGETLPDDNISQYGGDDDASDA
jgi:hypothetical protein